MAAQAPKTTTKARGQSTKQQPLQLKPRDPNKKKRGVTNSASMAVTEAFEFTAEFAQAGRRVMSITNTMLKGMEGEVFFDAVEELMSRGLTADQAVAHMNAA